MVAHAVSPNAPAASTSAGTKRGAAEAGATTDAWRVTRSKASLVHITNTVSPLLKLLLEAEQAPEEDAMDAPYMPDEVDEPEEEYDEGEIVDDERPPFPDAEYQAADPNLVAQIDGLEDEEAEYLPDDEPEPEEEYEEGDAVAEEFPMPADAAPEAADPSLLADIDGAGDEDEGEYEPAADADEPAEEYEEGDVVDDERPPFAGAEPEAADPALVAQIDGVEDEEADYQPTEEPEPEEEYEEGDAVAEEKEDVEDGDEQ